MKRCPKCNSTYSDESLNFCLADGAPLSSASDPDATVVMPPPPVNRPVTKVLSSDSSRPQTNNATFRYLIVGLLALVVGGGAVALFIWGTKNPSNSKPDATPSVASVASPASTFRRPTPLSKRIAVPANQMWVDTGLDVTGKLVHIQYESGQWRNSPTSGFNDGNGRRPFADQRLLLVPEADLSSLVGKTDTGAFFVGNSYDGHAGSGKLYLSINDIPGEYSDNSGTLYVTVTLSE